MANEEEMDVDDTRHVPRTSFKNCTSSLKQYFVLPKNGSKYYLKYTLLAFTVFGILGLGTFLLGGLVKWQLYM